MVKSQPQKGEELDFPLWIGFSEVSVILLCNVTRFSKLLAHCQILDISHFLYLPTNAADCMAICITILYFTCRCCKTLISFLFNEAVVLTKFCIVMNIEEYG